MDIHIHGKPANNAQDVAKTAPSSRCYSE